MSRLGKVTVGQEVWVIEKGDRVRAIIARTVPTPAQLKQVCDVLEIENGLE